MKFLLITRFTTALKLNVQLVSLKVVSVLFQTDEHESGNLLLHLSWHIENKMSKVLLHLKNNSHAISDCFKLFIECCDLCNAIPGELLRKFTMLDRLYKWSWL